MNMVCSCVCIHCSGCLSFGCHLLCSPSPSRGCCQIDQTLLVVAAGDVQLQPSVVAAILLPLMLLHRPPPPPPPLFHVCGSFFFFSKDVFLAIVRKLSKTRRGNVSQQQTSEWRRKFVVSCVFPDDAHNPLHRSIAENDRRAWQAGRVSLSSIWAPS